MANFKTFAELNAHLEICKRGCDLCEEQVEKLGNVEELNKPKKSTAPSKSEPININKKRDYFWDSTP